MPLFPLFSDSGNKKTTSAGAVALVAAGCRLFLMIYNQDFSAEGLMTVISTATAGFGLVKAKDHDK